MNYKTIIFALCLGMAGTLAAQSIYPLSLIHISEPTRH